MSAVMVAVFRKVTLGTEFLGSGARTHHKGYLWKNCTVSRHFLPLAALLLAALPATAQDMVWDDYGIGFKLPPGMKVTENNGESFTAEGNGLVLVLQPVKDRTVTEDDLAEAAVTMAVEAGYTTVTEADALELDDLYGYYIEGEMDGAKAFVIAMMDTLSANNYLAIILFNDRSRNSAVDLANSFYAYGE
jgi:hypothetical protein